MNDRPTSVYRRGADDGLYLGPLMALAVVLTGATAYVAWLALPAIAALVAVPALVYVRLRRSYLADPMRGTLSALWLEGICAFFLGGLVMALVAYAGMRWVCPTFIPDQFRMVIEVYSSAPGEGAREMAATLQRAVDARMLPTPVEMALELLYVAVFSGSLLSVVLAAVIRRRPVPPPVR